MFKDYNATLRWIIFWGVIAIVAQSTLSTAGALAAIIAGGLALGGILVKLYKTHRRKQALKDPFDAYFEPQDGVIKHSEISHPSRLRQKLQTTLKVKTELYVEFISLKFIGSGKQPRIMSLYDWNWGLGLKSPIINTHAVKDGTWYWNYNPPLHRPKERRIKIGVVYIATDSFDGVLEFGLTASDVPGSVIELPFKVESENG